MRAVVVPASSSTLRPAQREELGGGGGDGVLVVGAGGLPLADARFDEVQRARRNRAAVDAADDAGLVERGQVAAHGLGGDVVGLGELGDRGAALADHQSGDRLLALFRVHGPPFVWDMRALNVDMCWFYS